MIQALTIQTKFGESVRGAASVDADKEAIRQLVRSGRARFSEAIASSKASLPAIAIAGAVLLTLVSIVTHRPNAPVAGRMLTTTTERVVVGRGDSLWQLASHYGDPSVAMQDRVDMLAHLNGLRPGAPLMAGQRLLVPVSNPIELERRQVSLASR